MDLLGLGALGLVSLEWLAIGWLSGVSWPHPTPWAPRWGLRLLVGAALVGISLLLLALVGVSFASPPLPLAVAVAAASLIRWLSTNRSTASKSAHRNRALPTIALGAATGSMAVNASPERREGGERVGWAVLGAVLTAALVRALVMPEAGWDAYAHWGLKAQAFFHAGAIVDAGSAHEYYPPLVPLLESWLYLHRGAVLIDVGKTVWAVVGASFSVCVAWHLRLALPGNGARLAPLLALAVMLGTPHLLEGFWTGEADLALTAYLSLLALALLRWHDRPERGWLVQAMLFAAAAALTKYEGVFRVAVILTAFGLEVLLCRRPAQLAAATTVGLAAGLGYLAWGVFRGLHGIQVSPEHLSHLQPEAIGSVLLALAAALGGVRTGGGVVVSALGWLVAGRRIGQPPLRLLTLIVIGQVATTLLAFLVSSNPPVLQVQLSANRLFEQFMPIALFASAVWLVEALPGGVNIRGLLGLQEPDPHRPSPTERQPSLLRVVSEAWKAYSRRAATYQNWLLLSSVYFAVLGPSALLARALRSQMFDLDDNSRTSFWIERRPLDKTLAALERQF